MMKMIRALVALSMLSSSALAQGIAQLPAGTVWGNYTASRAPASPATITAMLDRAIGSTRGALLTRQSSGWLLLVPGTAGLPLLSGGTGADPAYGSIGLVGGGTGASLTASNGGIFYSTASAGAILAGTATASRMLLSGASAAPAWSTATWPATTTINQLLYSSAANTVVGLATANSGVLVTSSGGVPSISTTLPSGLTIPSPALSAPSIGVATGTSLALGGATLGSNAIAVTGTALFNGAITGAADVNSFSFNTVQVTSFRTTGISVFGDGSGKVASLLNTANSAVGWLVAADVPLGWSSAATAATASATTFQTTIDLQIWRDTANILAQRKGTSAQCFRVYNTFTDASNYERGDFCWTDTTNTLTIATQAAGTGTARNITFAPAGGTTSITGALSVSGQIKSTATTGTAPLVIASTTLVPNLYVARAAATDSCTACERGQEALTVTSVNTLSALSNSAVGTLFMLIVNGVVYTTAGGAPPVSVSGTAVTWNATNAGFSLATTDKVIAIYSF